MQHDPDTLYLYARIFEMPRRECNGGKLLPPTEPCKTAAEALRFWADALTKGKSK